MFAGWLLVRSWASHWRGLSACVYLCVRHLGNQGIPGHLLGRLGVQGCSRGIRIGLYMYTLRYFIPMSFHLSSRRKRRRPPCVCLSSVGFASVDLCDQSHISVHLYVAFCFYCEYMLSCYYWLDLRTRSCGSLTFIGLPDLLAPKRIHLTPLRHPRSCRRIIRQ